MISYGACVKFKHPVTYTKPFWHWLNANGAYIACVD